MSLSEAPVFDKLVSDFVCGWRDISGESYCGKSGRYAREDGAVHTTNGAGPHNMQLFVLASDGTVLHCLPGYWEAGDLARELAFAAELNAVWRDASLSRERKDERFRHMHLEHVRRHPRETVARSSMQGFDKKFEQKRAAVSDCLLPGGRGFKTTDRIMHERMAQRPFVAFDAFDVEAYTDYGRPKYDKKKAHLAPAE